MTSLFVESALAIAMIGAVIWGLAKMISKPKNKSPSKGGYGTALRDPDQS